MNKIIFLGTGNGATLDLYNTCFVIQNSIGNFLIDTGGSIEIIKRLEQSGIDYRAIKHIFISHSHTDHILGLFWMFKRLSRDIMNGTVTEPINIYCNDVVYEAIKGVAKLILPEKLMDAVYSVTNFIVLQDNDSYDINGVKYTFFDTHARGTKLFGFECLLNGKKVFFLGDETINPQLYNRIMGCDFVMHEAFCLESEENIFHAYEKHHSTVKNACSIMNSLGIKNLILYHTEESHGEQRKELYTKEAVEYFKGNIFVPNDLEEIKIV